MSKKKKIAIVVTCFLIVVSIGAILFGRSFAVPLENDVRVKENSDLTYYVDVMYDGKDVTSTSSTDTITAEVRSGYIFVEDKLPEGLTFKGFVESNDGTIGAVRRGDTSKTCSGYVVDGVAGLTYDDATRTVSFKVKNLQAGCKITVGIITTTPTLPADKKRLDFFNTAFAKEDAFSASSNTVHAYIGDPDEVTYNVVYKYSGTVPEGAPALPATGSYPSGSEVAVLNNITLDGYTFSGWTTTDATVSNGKFTMPNKTVTFTGSFTAKPKNYKVTYSITGQVPDGYVVPKEKSYGEKDAVYVDSLSVGDVINGYRFKGWTTTDVTVSDGSFEMPKKNVTFTGSFERISYTVTYAFQGSIIPPDASSLLPAVKSYYPGDNVTLAADPITEGYKFLGWYYSKTFKMPEENIIIYGEWKKEVGLFVPDIKTTIVNQKEYFSADDVVQFKITVKNNATFEIKDVMIQNHLAGSEFINGDNYTLLSSSFAKINTLAALASVDLYATYKVGNDPVKTLTNVFTLDGALADGDYSLDTSKEYKDEDTFNVANIALNITKVDKDNNILTGAEFKLYSDSSKTNLIGTGVSFNKLVPNSTYYLDETRAPTGFVLIGKTLQVKVDSTGNVSIDGYTVTNNNGVADVNILNNKINILPNTGGSGNLPFVIGGIVVIIASIVAYLYYISRKKG